MEERLAAAQDRERQEQEPALAEYPAKVATAKDAGELGPIGSLIQDAPRPESRAIAVAAFEEIANAQVTKRI